MNYWINHALIPQIKDFIEEKPEKYDYFVGVKGRKLLPGYR